MLTELSKIDSKSLINNINNKPKCDPCGTPEVTKKSLET